jgi:TonB family protein
MLATGVALLAARAASVPAPLQDVVENRTRLELPRIVFLPSPGPAGGGGGGGGNRQPKQPSRAESPGREGLTAAAFATSVVSTPSPDTMQVPQPAVLESRTVSWATALLAGVPDAPASLPFAQGPGDGGGFGDGSGAGIGSGRGPGVGPGIGGGVGGGIHRPGGAVLPPIVVTRVRPKYTADAMRDTIQGTVGLEVVVGREGIPVTIRVTKSLDPGGLDDEAVAAARQWRFIPGRIGDTPVDVLVTILMDFRIS